MSLVYRGTTDSTKHAYSLITTLIKDPEVDIFQTLQKSKLPVVTTSSWDKTVSTVAVSTRVNGQNVGHMLYKNNLTRQYFHLDK